MPNEGTLYILENICVLFGPFHLVRKLQVHFGAECFDLARKRDRKPEPHSESKLTTKDCDGSEQEKTTDPKK